MTKNKLVIGMSLTMLVAFWGGGAAHADYTSIAHKPVPVSIDPPAVAGSGHTESNRPLTFGDSPVVSPYISRQRTKHSERKAAALHLKEHYAKVREDQIVKHNPQDNFN